MAIAKPGGKFSRDGSVGGIRLAEDALSEIIDAITALSEGVPSTGPATLTGAYEIDGGLLIVCEAGSTEGFAIKDSSGNFIGGVGPTGGWKTFGDMVQAGFSATGPFVGLDGQSNPPPILFPSTTYRGGGRVWGWNGTPAAGWVAGVTNVNDRWINFATGVEYICTVTGGGTGPGTWIQIGFQPGNDGFGNNLVSLTVDGHIIVWDLNGLYPNTPLNLGTSTNPWGVIYVRTPANVQTASYVPAIADKNHCVELNSASATTVTLNTGVFAAGDTFEVCRYGAGTVTFAAGSGFTIRTPNTSAITAQYGTAKVRFRSATEAVLSGLI